MTYILSAQRDADLPDWWARYTGYLEGVRDRFPPGAWALAASDWYFDFNDHRCPHDAWLEQISLTEHGTGLRREHREVTLSIRLLGAYHDGHIELRYPRVFSYRLEQHPGGSGHADWRYDEFRLSQRGNLVHEIEWSEAHASGTWLIEASDIQYQWIAPAAA